MNKNRILLGLGGVALVAALAGATVVGADDHKPPKAAIDKMKQGIENPTEGGGGMGDPSQVSGAVLVLRDPETGFVLRDERGLPRVLTDDKGNAVDIQPQQVPAEQRLAQGRAEERQQRAGKGDAQAQKELQDEAAKTREAIQKHAPTRPGQVPPQVVLPNRP